MYLCVLATMSFCQRIVHFLNIHRSFYELRGIKVKVSSSKGSLLAWSESSHEMKTRDLSHDGSRVKSYNLFTLINLMTIKYYRHHNCHAITLIGLSCRVLTTFEHGPNCTDSKWKVMLGWFLKRNYFNRIMLQETRQCRFWKRIFIKDTELMKNEKPIKFTQLYSRQKQKGKQTA